MAKTGISEALTISEAAKRKGITRQAMHCAIRASKVKTVSALGRVGVMPEELAKYEPNAKKTGPRA